MMTRPTSSDPALTMLPEADPKDRVFDLVGISKRYGRTKALVEVTLGLCAGEFLGVVGHNGAGKSTLMRVLAGTEPPTGGQLNLHGRPAPEDYGPNEARALGVFCSAQTSMLCEDLRAYENVYILDPDFRGDRAAARDAVVEAVERLFPSLTIDPDARADTLSVVHRQALQLALVARGLLRPNSVLLLDEPTASLPDELSDELFAGIRGLVRGERSVVLITHKVREVLEQCQRIVAMAAGSVILDSPTSELDFDGVISAMAGTELSVAHRAESVVESPRAAAPEGPAEALLRLDVGGLRTDSPHDLVVHEGEIVGLGGLEGQGQDVVLERAWSSLRMSFSRPGGRGWKRRVRTGFVTGDRAGAGIYPLWSIEQNLVAGSLAKVSRARVLNRKREMRVAEHWISELGIIGQRQDNIMTLSGGNQQKVLFGRALAGDPQLLILDDPFRGVDVGSKFDSYDLLRKLAAEHGVAILWYSSELEELQRCDAVYVMYQGKLVRRMDAKDLNSSTFMSSSFQS
ncbi:MAG: ATP-binding cassette domain-containing protein [Nocardioides sp.]